MSFRPARSFGLDRRARSAKGKGLFRKAPDPKEVGERLGWLLRRSAKLGLKRTGWANGTWTAEVEFHDLASPARFSIGAEAELVVRAQTARLGPGYHRHILARLGPILEELEYAWVDDAPDPAIGMCAWLAGELAEEGQLRIGIPENRAFVCDAPVLTALGPRDEAWRAAAIADPSKCADAFPWWDDKPGRSALARALLAMWHEVAWREPIDNAEQALLESIDDDLRAVRKADPTAPIPYADWAEVLHWANADPKRITDVRALAKDAPGTIGYRRFEMDVPLSGGWSVRLPGSFTGRWEDDGARYWATDGDRVVEFASLTGAETIDSAALLAVAPERFPVIDRFVDGARAARAEVHDEDHIHIVHGLVACAPHVAILTCKGAASEEPWALATWRSLRHE